MKKMTGWKVTAKIIFKVLYLACALTKNEDV